MAKYYVQSAPNWQYYGELEPTTTATSSASTIPFFDKVKNWYSSHVGPGKTIFGGAGKGSGGLKSITQPIKDIQSTQLWSDGPKISTAANTINGIVQGAQAIGGLYDNSQTSQTIDDLKQDINALKLSNPMYAENLTPDQTALLRKLSSDNYSEANTGDVVKGVVKGIPSALFGALMGGLTGNIPGALIGGLGSLINSGISGYGTGQQDTVNELQALYNSLNQGYSEYRQMKRPANLYSAGLQSKYFNQFQ